MRAERHDLRGRGGPGEAPGEHAGADDDDEVERGREQRRAPRDETAM